MVVVVVFVQTAILARAKRAAPDMVVEVAEEEVRVEEIDSMPLHCNGM